MKKLLLIMTLLLLSAFFCSCTVSQSLTESSSSSYQKNTSSRVTGDSAYSAPIFSTPKNSISHLKFYSFLDKYQKCALTLSDNKQELFKNRKPWIIAPNGYIFSESFISDDKTLYVKIVETNNPNSFRWFRACYTHASCNLNELVDDQLLKSFDKEFTYADKYTLYTNDGYSVNSAACDFEDKTYITYVNLSAMGPEFLYDYIEDFREFYSPFSYIINNEQLLTNEMLELIFDLEVPSYESLKETLKIFDIDEMLTSDSSRYNNVASEKGVIATNADWDLFLQKVKYKKYTVEAQPDNSEWTQAVKDCLASEDSHNSSVIIIESWEFNWNGKKSAVINAGNVVPLNLKTGENIEDFTAKHIKDEDAMLYKMSILFTEGNAPNILFNDSVKVPYMGLDGSKNVRWYSVYQYDKDGGITICQTNKDYGSYRDFMDNTDFLVCDVDGDNQVELLYQRTFTNALRRSFGKFDLINGIPEMTFSNLL